MVWHLFDVFKCFLLCLSIIMVNHSFDGYESIRYYSLFVFARLHITISFEIGTSCDGLKPFGNLPYIFFLLIFGRVFGFSQSKFDSFRNRKALQSKHTRSSIFVRFIANFKIQNFRLRLFYARAAERNEVGNGNIFMRTIWMDCIVTQ